MQRLPKHLHKTQYTVFILSYIILSYMSDRIILIYICRDFQFIVNGTVNHIEYFCLDTWVLQQSLFVKTYIHIHSGKLKLK